MKTRIYLLWMACLLVFMQPALAQDDFVGDGFGGRSWYKPANIVGGYDMAASVVKGQLYMWASEGSTAFITPIPYNASPSSYPIVGGIHNVDSQDQTTPFDINPRIALTTFTDATFHSGARGGAYANPYPVAGFTDVKLISITTLGALIKTDGTGWVWGTPLATAINSSGFELSFNGRQAGFHTPVQVISDAKHVSTGDSHIAFVKNDGTVWSLGDNEYGNFGNNTTTPADINTYNPAINYSTYPVIPMSTTPVKMNGITNAVRVAAFGNNGLPGIGGPDSSPPGTIILKADGTVWVAGAGGVLVANNPNNTPKQVLGLTNVVDIKCNGNAGIALTANGDVYTWGRNTITHTINTTPQQVQFLLNDSKKIVAIEAKSFRAGLDTYEQVQFWALDEDHKLWTWGGPQTVTGASTTQSLDIPHIVARHVADMNIFKNGVYITRTTDYPTDERLWSTSQAQATFFTLNTSYDAIWSPQNSDIVNGYWEKFLGTSAANNWVPANPGAWGAGFSEIGTVETPAAAGTIDCAKTQLSPAPVNGTASQTNLSITVTVTTAGTFTPTVSGSGMSLVDPSYVINATTTGVQTFYVPLKYDGTALGTLTFGLSPAGNCTADLTKGPKNTITPVWTLECVPSVGPMLKK